MRWGVSQGSPEKDNQEDICTSIDTDKKKYIIGMAYALWRLRSPTVCKLESQESWLCSIIPTKFKGLRTQLGVGQGLVGAVGALTIDIAPQLRSWKTRSSDVHSRRKICPFSPLCSTWTPVEWRMPTHLGEGYLFHYLLIEILISSGNTLIDHTQK